MADVSAPVRVLLVDDEALIRAGFRALLDSEDDFVVAAEAANGAEAVRRARETTVDVVLMDLRMPAMDGLEATRHLVAANSRAKVLVVTTFDDDEHVFGALRAGASGFVLKDTPPERLLEAIRVVAGGESLLGPDITRRVIAAYVSQAPSGGQSARLATLTDREQDVLEQVALGRSNAEIAAALYLGVPTVKTHVGRLLAKLGARDRAQLVIAAYETGLVTPGAP